MTKATGLEVGETAPDFTAPLVRAGEETEDVPISRFLDDTPVLLTFYTVDFSPDCVEEWCSFRDFDWFASNDYIEVIGISKSRPYLHKRFISYLDLTFPLYSDTDLDVAEKFEVKYRTFHMFPRARRSCFLIDTDRTVRYRWLGEHWLDPTRAVPPVGEIHESITDILDLNEEASPPEL